MKTFISFLIGIGVYAIILVILSLINMIIPMEKVFECVTWTSILFISVGAGIGTHYYLEKYVENDMEESPSNHWFKEFDSEIELARWLNGANFIKKVTAITYNSKRDKYIIFYFSK